MDFRTVYTHTAVQGSIGSETTNNSNAISIGRAKAVSVQLIGTDFVDAAGSVTLSMDVSNDGGNWVDYNLLVDNVTGSADFDMIRVGAKNLTTSTSICLLMYPIPAYQYARTSITYNHLGSISVILGISE